MQIVDNHDQKVILVLVWAGIVKNSFASFFKIQMKTVFKKVRLQKISEEVANQVRQLVEDGKLQPGEKLPSERAFAEILGVGRSSLREAIHILETQGFVETRNRQGVFIASLGSSIISDPLRRILEEDRNKVIQLYEVRKDIELASAWAAALHRQADDLEKMDQALKKMDKDAKHGKIFLVNDLEFHITIAQSGNNIFRGHILKNIFDAYSEHLAYVVDAMTTDKSNIIKVLDQHKNVFDAIEEQDPALAKDLMEEHLVWVEEELKLFIERTSSQV